MLILPASVAPSDEPIYSATNRGNKLKRGATYVHAGALPYAYGPHGYKEVCTAILETDQS